MSGRHQEDVHQEDVLSNVPVDVPADVQSCVDQSGAYKSMSLGERLAPTATKACHSHDDGTESNKKILGLQADASSFFKERT